MGTIEQAIEIAVIAHHGQVDKGGKAYIGHPLRVMSAMQTEEECIVAVLHDVLEDCPDDAWRVAEAGFSPAVLEALDALTKRPGEPYGDFMVRVVLNPLAKRVKIADMRDNMDLSRIPNPTEKDHARVAKYAKYLAVLEG